MLSEHFERLQQLNLLRQAGRDVEECADPALRRLLRQAARAAGNDSSAIIRFFPEQGNFAADPAVEKRITIL